MVAHQHAHSAYHHPAAERLAQQKPLSLKPPADGYDNSLNSLLEAFHTLLMAHPLGDEQLQKHNDHLRRHMRRIHARDGPGAFNRLALKKRAFSFHFRLSEKEVMRILDPIFY